MKNSPSKGEITIELSEKEVVNFGESQGENMSEDCESAG